MSQPQHVAQTLKSKIGERKKESVRGSGRKREGKTEGGRKGWMGERIEGREGRMKGGREDIGR